MQAGQNANMATQHMGVIRKAATTATTNLLKNNSKRFRV